MVSEPPMTEALIAIFLWKFGLLKSSNFHLCKEHVFEKKKKGSPKIKFRKKEDIRHKEENYKVVQKRFVLVAINISTLSCEFFLWFCEEFDKVWTSSVECYFLTSTVTFAHSVCISVTF